MLQPVSVSKPSGTGSCTGAAALCVAPAFGSALPPEESLQPASAPRTSAAIPAARTRRGARLCLGAEDALPAPVGTGIEQSVIKSSVLGRALQPVDATLSHFHIPPGG